MRLCAMANSGIQVRHWQHLLQYQLQHGDASFTFDPVKVSPCNAAGQGCRPCCIYKAGATKGPKLSFGTLRAAPEQPLRKSCTQLACQCLQLAELHTHGTAATMRSHHCTLQQEQICFFVGCAHTCFLASLSSSMCWVTSSITSCRVSIQSTVSRSACMVCSTASCRSDSPSAMNRQIISPPVDLVAGQGAWAQHLMPTKHLRPQQPLVERAARDCCKKNNGLPVKQFLAGQTACRFSSKPTKVFASVSLQSKHASIAWSTTQAHGTIAFCFGTGSVGFMKARVYLGPEGPLNGTLACTSQPRHNRWPLKSAMRKAGIVYGHEVQS